MSAVRTNAITPPASLPQNMDVQHFDLGDGKFCRVILELGTEAHNGVDHLVIFGQAYEVTSSGDLVQAAVGYPSRTTRTARTTILSAVGDTVDIVDAWCRVAETYDPGVNQYAVVNGKPTTPGATYGEKVWDSLGLRVLEWKRGEADLHAEQKAEEMINVLNTSPIRLGLSFR